MQSDGRVPGPLQYYRPSIDLPVHLFIYVFIWHIKHIHRTMAITCFRHTGRIGVETLKGQYHHFDEIWHCIGPTFLVRELKTDPRSSTPLSRYRRSKYERCTTLWIVLHYLHCLNVCAVLNWPPVIKTFTLVISSNFIKPKRFSHLFITVKFIK